MAFISKTYVVSRDVTIDAPRNHTFDRLSNLNDFSEWAVWFNPDSLKIEIPGAASGLGAQLMFQDANNTNGMLEITGFKAPTMMAYKLVYNGEIGATGKWLFDSVNDHQTKVTWTFEGTMPYYLRWVNLTIDKRVGADLAASLARAQQFAPTAK